MRSITSVAAVILLAGAFTAQAQNAEGDFSHKARAAHHSKASDRTQRSGRAEREPSSIGDEEVTFPFIPEGEAGGRLPNYFTNCEEPIVPKFCPP
jgi:hypothetical protein